MSQCNVCLLGRMYDKDGNYGVMWWTNRSVEQYKSRSDCMVKQYSKFSYFGKHVSKIDLSCNPTEKQCLNEPD